MYGLLLTLHLLAASIWTGGHIILSLIILPRVLKERSPERLLAFESAYEKIGMPALVVQIVTGLTLAYQMLPHIPSWFDMSIPIAHGIVAKLILLGLTVVFALDARLRVVPKLSPANLNDMAFHIIAVTIFSILFVIVGVSFRAGWWF
ncbi:copper resistance protein CopD [Terasakiispira papahanaumokuakeensis]|uniref:Copper resistance protein CopD n=1 Tax=Terasakiispira papahanaumokuakeensis TaxID=197479 RepID=A0A1E2VAN5_9GAMM|nr:CopD family protein [Terasakiispira papahanaumokuakeensis]ODC03896.1 copper resistance protein CopD [Terasakiispira papahanaumokuakeensis]